MGEPRLNLRWSRLVLLVVAGSVACQAIAHYVPRPSVWPSVLFTAFATYGLFFAVRGIKRGLGFVSTNRHPDALTTTIVLANATMRREILRGVAHLNVFLIGVLSLGPPSWFGEFFTASIFFLVYTLNVNATLDHTLTRRLQTAHGRDTRIAADKLRKDGKHG